MSGSSDGQRFWIGITSAFVIPTVMFVYSQGMTAQSINELTKSVDKFQVSLDITNSRVEDSARVAANNGAAINTLNKQVDKLENDLRDQQKRVNSLEVATNRSR